MCRFLSSINFPGLAGFGINVSKLTCGPPPESNTVLAAAPGTTPDLKTNSLNFTANADCFGPGNPSRTLITGLVGYYPFSGNPNDESGNGNNGVLRDLTSTNGPNALGFATLAYGKYGKLNAAYHFNDLSDFIAIPVSPLSFGATLTAPNILGLPVDKFSIYVRYKANSNGTLVESGSTIQRIALLADSTNKVSFSWTFPFYNGTLLPGPDVNFAPPSISVPENSWINVVLNFSNSNLSIYVNGCLKASQPTTFAIGDGISGLDFGATQGMSFLSNYFNGSMDEIRFYNRSLTNKEIDYLLNH